MWNRSLSPLARPTHSAPRYRCTPRVSLPSPCTQQLLACLPFNPLRSLPSSHSYTPPPPWIASRPIPTLAFVVRFRLTSKPATLMGATLDVPPRTLQMGTASSPTRYACCLVLPLRLSQEAVPLVSQPDGLPASPLSLSLSLNHSLCPPPPPPLSLSLRPPVPLDHASSMSRPPPFSHGALFLTDMRVAVVPCLPAMSVPAVCMRSSRLTVTALLLPRWRRAPISSPPTQQRGIATLPSAVAVPPPLLSPSPRPPTCTERRALLPPVAGTLMTSA